VTRRGLKRENESRNERRRKGRKREADISIIHDIVLFSITKQPPKSKKERPNKRERNGGGKGKAKTESNSGAVGSRPPSLLPSLLPPKVRKSEMRKIGKEKKTVRERERASVKDERRDEKDKKSKAKHHQTWKNKK
jgi:hypothetical protein